MKPRFLRLPLWLALFSVAGALSAADYEPKPADPYFAKFNPRRAPEPGPLMLARGDRLALLGDSITEQRMYTRIVETYLTACRPDLAIETRQLGWSGETVARMRRRLVSDCLRFEPDVIALCYGMNDSKYRPYDEINGQWFRENLTAAVEEMKAADARVLIVSPGIAEKYAVWVGSRAGTLDEHNLNLCALRDIGIDVAERLQVRFADVFWPMLQAGFTARARYGGDPDRPYGLAGRDGIHPGWAGHLVMAYSVLRGLGLDGEIGTVKVDIAAKTATASAGHRVESFDGKTLRITSERYPFCAEGPVERDSSIRSGMSLVPFNQELNRFLLVIDGPENASYTIRWGDEFRSFSAAAMKEGINLAEIFPRNPFNDAFAQIDRAVAEKQEFETRQVRQLMHGPEGRADQEGVVARTEAERAKLLAKIGSLVVPIEHTIEIQSR